MLDNGVTLDSTTIIQNCEWSGSSSSCGQAQSGRDTFKTTVKILDSDGNVLSQVDQIRNTDSGYYANAHKYTDQVIYNSAGSNKFDWTWTGIDGDSTPVDLGGPNLLGAKLTMTYDNTVLEESTSTALTNLQEELAEFEEEIIEFTMEEEIEVTMEVEEMEEIQETFSFTPMLMVFEEEEIMEEEIVMEEESIIEETPMTTSFFSAVTQEEEIYEETEEITASFLPVVSQEEEMVQEEEEIIEESPIMESAQEEEVIEEEETVAKGPMKMVQNTHEEKEEKAIEEKEEIKEEKVKEESKVAEKKEAEEKEVAEEESSSESTTEVSSANTSEQKKIQQKKALVKNIDRVMDKIDREIKDLSKNLNIKNLIKLEAIISEQASLVAYNKVEFYKPKDIYLDQVNIFDSRKIYSNVTLASYTKNDTLEIKTKKLNEIHYKKQKILMELKELNNG